jgi:hypothetical protein
MAVIKVLPFTWTKLEQFENCAFRHLKVDLDRQFSDDDRNRDVMDWGIKVHKAMEAALKTNTPLPDDMLPFQEYVDRIRRGVGELLVEEKYALKKDLTPCNYHSPVAWYRGKNDVVRIAPPYAMCADFKTGKRKDPKKVSQYGKQKNQQLLLGAQCVFSHHPDVKVVQSKFIWLAEGLEDDEVYTRERVADEWTSDLLPRVERYIWCAENMSFVPRPGGLCKEFCPVKICSYYKKGSR